MKTRAEKFRVFCIMMREVFPEAKDYAPGATISAFVDAFKATHPDRTKPAGIQAFDDPAFHAPMACYAIRNEVTGSRYIGRARYGFAKRYPKCAWWAEHHNERLTSELELYGRAAFRVSIFVCIDEADMARVEADLLRTHRAHTLNLRPEADA